MPGTSLHQKAKKKLTDGFSSWRKKRRSRTSLSEASSESNSPCSPPPTSLSLQDVSSSLDLARTRSHNDVVFRHQQLQQQQQQQRHRHHSTGDAVGGYSSSDEFLGQARSRDVPDKADSATTSSSSSPGSPDAPYPIAASSPPSSISPSLPPRHPAYRPGPIAVPPPSSSPPALPPTPNSPNHRPAFLLSPAEGDRFINNLFSDIVTPSTTDTETDGEATLVGDDEDFDDPAYNFDVFDDDDDDDAGLVMGFGSPTTTLSPPVSPAARSTGDEVFWSADDEASVESSVGREKGKGKVRGGGVRDKSERGERGFKQYCGLVGNLLSERAGEEKPPSLVGPSASVIRDRDGLIAGVEGDALSDSEYSSDSTLLNLTISSDEQGDAEDEGDSKGVVLKPSSSASPPKKMLQIRVRGRPDRRAPGVQRDLHGTRAHGSGEPAIGLELAAVSLPFSGSWDQSGRQSSGGIDSPSLGRGSKGQACGRGDDSGVEESGSDVGMLSGRGEGTKGEMLSQNGALRSRDAVSPSLGRNGAGRAIGHHGAVRGPDGGTPKAEGGGPVEDARRCDESLQTKESEQHLLPDLRDERGSGVDELVEGQVSYLSHSHSAPSFHTIKEDDSSFQLLPLPVMRAMRSSSADTDMLTQIHSMLDLKLHTQLSLFDRPVTTTATPLPSSSNSTVISTGNAVCPDAEDTNSDAFEKDDRAADVVKRKTPKRSNDAPSSIRTTDKPPAAPTLSTATATTTATDQKPPKAQRPMSLRFPSPTSSASSSPQPTRSAILRQHQRKTEKPKKVKFGFPDDIARAHRHHHQPPAQLTSGAASSSSSRNLWLPQDETFPRETFPKTRLAEESFPREVSRRGAPGFSRTRALHIENIPEHLCLCHCDMVCTRDVEVKHVRISSDSVVSPDTVQQPIQLLAVYKLKVCHHPQCTEDNKDLPLLLCRQCDQDIHKHPQYAGHLVLDATNKRSSGGAFSRQSRSPADTDSDNEAHHDEDGRQLFVKKPSKEYKRNRSPSEVERKLKRKKAVKKRSFSKNDSQQLSTYGLEAALAQIAHPEGPDLMANLTPDTDGGGGGGGARDGGGGASELARKDSSATSSCSGDASGLTARQESMVEATSPSLDPGLPPPMPRTPVRRQSRIALQDNYFTIKICRSDPGESEDLEVVASIISTTLREALEPILERRGMDISTVNAFIEKSNTPLPMSSDTTFLAGNTLEIKEKDDQGTEMVTQGAGGKQQRPSSAPKASSSSGKGSKSSGRYSRRDSIGIPTLLEPPPSKQRRGSLQLPFFASQNKGTELRAPDDPFGSLRSRRGQNLSIDDTYSVPSTSPQGTLTFSEGKKIKSQKLSVVSLFANNNASASKDREKHEQLHEILGSYSNHGLPPMPKLLALGQATFDESAFQMEAHWSVLVENASSLTKRQHDQQEAIWELLNTELNYINQIRVIIDVFKSCLLNVQEGELLNEIELDRLFSNIDKILETNCKLWQDSLTKVLDDARDKHLPLNPSLMKMAFTIEFQKLIQPYTKYCMEQKQCLEYMKSRYNDNDLFKIFVMWAEAQKQCNRLKLTDLLVKPMQRLTKYSLLLQAILRKSEDDRQRRDLLEMIASVDKYVSSINSQMQQQHELERLEALMTKIEPYDAVEGSTDECVKIIQEYNSNFNLMSPMSGFRTHRTRSLLMHSSLRMKEAQSRTDVDCFLFTDLLLVCKASKRMDKFKIIRPPMRLDQLIAADLKDKGSFLLIYINEYHIPMSAFTFHGDQASIRVWLEKIREAQAVYLAHKREDHDKWIETKVTVTEEVEYTPLPGEGPLTMTVFPRSASMESTEGRFMPNIGAGRPGDLSPQKSPTSMAGRGGGMLERTGSCNELPAASSTSMGIYRVAEQHASSSPDFTDRNHRPVKACHSVPNMAGGQLRVVDFDDDDSSSSGGLTMSVHAAVGSSSYSSMSNLAEPGPVDDEEYNGRYNKSNPRRVSRSEKRYYTADSIQELRHKDKDSTIHKRLSWQNENHLEEKLRKKVLSTDSVHSIPSSSGVSSTGSLHLNPESDIHEESEMTRSGSSRTLQGDISPKSDGGAVDLNSQSTRAKSSPDIVMLFNSLRTGEQEDGISSVDLPPMADAERHGRLSQAQILKMKKQLLLNTDVEASEV